MKATFKNVFLSVLFIGIGALSIQASNVPAPIVDDILAWEILYDQDGIVISYKLEECISNRPMLCLQVENQNGTDQTVTFTATIADPGNLNPTTLDFSKSVQANSILTGDCADPMGRTGLLKMLYIQYQSPEVSVEVQ